MNILKKNLSWKTKKKFNKTKYNNISIFGCLFYMNLRFALLSLTKQNNFILLQKKEKIN